MVQDFCIKGPMEPQQQQHTCARTHIYMYEEKTMAYPTQKEIWERMGRNASRKISYVHMSVYLTLLLYMIINKKKI